MRAGSTQMQIFTVLSKQLLLRDHTKTSDHCKFSGGSN